MSKFNSAKNNLKKYKRLSNKTNRANIQKDISNQVYGTFYLENDNKKSYRGLYNMGRPQASVGAKMNKTIKDDRVFY